MADPPSPPPADPPPDTTPAAAAQAPSPSTGALHPVSPDADLLPFVATPPPRLVARATDAIAPSLLEPPAAEDGGFCFEPAGEAAGSLRSTVRGRANCMVVMGPERSPRVPCAARKRREAPPFTTAGARSLMVVAVLEAVALPFAVRPTAAEKHQLFTTSRGRCGQYLGATAATVR